MHIDDCWYKGTCNKECKSSCLRFLEMVYLCESSNLPEDMWFPIKLIADRDRDAFVELAKIKKDIRGWVHYGNNLYLYSSNFGNGKTSWAVKLMLAYFNLRWAGNGFKRRALFISVPEFLKKNKEVINNPDPEFFELRDDIAECDLVIWDDIASTTLTNYDHSVLLPYIDQRTLARKSNIFTGNADGAEIIKYLGGRLASRVWNNSTVLEFKSEDKRGLH